MIHVEMEWTGKGARVFSSIPQKCPRCGAAVTPEVVHLCGDRLPKTKRRAKSHLPTPAFASRIEAARWISVKAYGHKMAARVIVNQPDSRKTAFRDAARMLHPDMPGGSHEDFVRLQQAMEMLQ